jgi:hypothetical protein
MNLVRCVIVVLVAAVCCTPPVCGCSPPDSPSAVVYGNVTDSGAPATHAAMSASATPTGVSCVQGTMYDWGSADSLGRYRLRVFGAGIVDSGCVFVGARFPAQGSNARDTVLGPFKLRFQLNLPFDSVHVNIVLSP